MPPRQLTTMSLPRELLRRGSVGVHPAGRGCAGASPQAGDLTTAQARRLLGDDVIIGRSTHSVDQAAEADADAALDYFCIGPVWETPTKPGRAAVGLDPVRAVAASATTTPWFAIGGIAEGERLDAVIEAGASRIVVVRAVTDAADPGACARSLRARLG